ncbi:FtsX-like permease family protein [Leuconostoc carnosum]|uniref:ABC transporter permease n=1 Tax=Leuconostoc carnosum TaxID=1252 RepID=UPI00123ACE12|nr:FtsX-like permease family protein [Leuconostoc carnosum]KAA8370893.1 FtsX-like permease family protein [Leuconostoc carnosum]KAA8382536.1 FtsX-like permease family protein [Leuconostoc carnosum]
MLYWKLSWQSIVKNRLEYLPFILAGSAAVALNLIMQLLIYSQGVKQLIASTAVIELLSFGQIVISILSIIFLLYTYSFLNKRKQSEFGLFSILGMQKKDLIKISWRQQLTSFVIIIFLGLVSGIVFSKALILLFMKLVGGTNFQLDVSWLPITFVFIFFAFCFSFLFFTDVFAILKLKTISLLHASQTGASEPKSHWILLVLGISLLAYGYYISLTVDSPLKAITQFFIAVILVVIATYLLFIVGSTIVLKIMRQNDHYYYQTNHFVTISNMLFRMRQNATGLASITLLTTMALVVMVTTVAMFAGQEDYVNKQFPRAIIVTNTSNKKLASKEVNKIARKHDVAIARSYDIIMSSPIAGYLSSQNKVQPLTDQSATSANNLSEFQFITEKQYQLITGRPSQKLGSNEIYVYDRQGTFKGNQLTFLDQKYHVKGILANIKGIPEMQVNMTHSMIVVIPSESITTKMSDQYNDLGDEKRSITYNQQLLFDLKGTSNHRKHFLSEISKIPNLKVEDKFSTISVMKSFYGGFVFIGLVFSISFIMATGLIIYYKQISEGRSDQKQFDILQKVGMSNDEVKRTIKSQIMWIFGLPIVVAVIHLCFAMPMIHKILQLFGVTIGTVVYTTTVLTVIGVIIIYYFIYLQTSKTYYRQVTQKNES